MAGRTILAAALGMCLVIASPAAAADALPLVWGNPQIARDVVSGQANMLIIGDSLQNHHQKDAYLARWSPEHFGGITFAVDFSGDRFGGAFSPWFYPAWVSSMTLRVPGDPPGPDGLTAITPSTSVHWVFDDLEVPDDNGLILNNRFLSAKVSPYMDDVHFGRSWIPDSNGQIVADTIIYTGPSGLSSGIVMEAWQGTDYYAPPLVSVPISAYAATPGVQKVSITLEPGQWDPQQDLRVQFRMLAGTTPTEGSTFTAFGTRFHTSTGLSLTTISQGGEGVGYFLDQQNCTDENLAGFLEATETNIAYVWLGQNDPIDDWQEFMGQLLDRYKAAKPDLRFVLISSYDTGFSKMPLQAQALYEICTQRDDAVFLNLFGAAGDFDFLNANYLSDGVHQNVAGCAYFADLIWDLMTDAALDRSSGDFNADGSVGADDIDMFCANIGNPMYDLDGDGDADTDDLDMLIHELVMTTVGVGTEYGDFNLDGKVDTTDLTRLAANYGDGNWKWDDGNANRYIDTDIDNTDLTILAAYYGFDATAEPTPEPATMGLLALGGLAMFRRRLARTILIGVAALGMCLVIATPAAADIFDMPDGLTSLEFVTVGDPGNEGEQCRLPADKQYYGSVAYVYDIAAYEVTAGQYTEFLNAVAVTDTYGLYEEEMADTTGYHIWGCNIQRSGSSGSYAYSVAADWADRPVNYVNWGDAARFCNWLTNGQLTGLQDSTTTEDGSYTMNGAMTDAELWALVRNPQAHYVIPAREEWYKAAYYDGDLDVYYDYPTGSDTAPSNDLVDPDPGNSANWGDAVGWTIGHPYYRTEVGEFENSASPYGTFDQAGNVWEWTEATHAGVPNARGQRGSSFNYGLDWFMRCDTTIWDPATGGACPYTNGMRVARLYLGDFDGDGDVDAHDIDNLCDNLTGSGIPAGDPKYDLDGDGDADTDDLDMLIHELVMTAVGVGTEYGDFNLDGLIDNTDLTILATYYGAGTTWAEGNANRHQDYVTDNTDLTILAAYYGFDATADTVPEPATLSLLAIGGVTSLLRRRSKV